MIKLSKKTKNKGICLSILLGSSSLLFACAIETEHTSVSLEIAHAKLDHDRVRLLLSESTYIVIEKVGNLHTSQRQFIKQNLFASETVALDSMLNGKIEMINFSQVATLGKRSYRTFFSDTADEVVLLIRRNANSAGCDDVVSSTSCREAAVGEIFVPKMNLGTFDFSSEYRFSVSDGVAVYIRNQYKELEKQPIAKIPYVLNRGNESRMLLVEMNYPNLHKEEIEPTD